MIDLSIGTIVNEGYAYFKRRMGFYISMALVFIIVMVAVYLICEKLGTWGNIIARLIEIYISAGVIKIILDDLNGKEPELADMFTAYDVYINFLIAGILYGLIVAVGTLALIVPGIILAIMFQFYKYAIIDKKLGITESLNYSKELTRGYKWTIFGIDIVLILINLGGALLFLVGLIFTIPITMIAEAIMYKKLVSNLEGIETNNLEGLA